jgi:hypothetical protein
MPPTEEQRAFIEHPGGAFVTACPGAGKTRAVVARVAHLVGAMPPRRGIAVLSFTNSAIDEFVARCHKEGIAHALKHPGFAGTFDSFLRQFLFLPGGIEGFPSRPVVVDSWDTIGIEIRLNGANAFAGGGVSLDRFDAETNAIDPRAIGNAALRAHVEEHRPAYENAARSRRRNLCRAGYVSAADVRIQVLSRLQQNEWRASLGRALAARFHEIIVDEAQDCNPSDSQIIEWLRESGASVSIVADPDQAIYAFRHGHPAELASLAERFDERSRLALTNNFRSSPAVCRVAATLRQRQVPDASVGETAVVNEPVHILSYHGNRVPDAVGRRFGEIFHAAGIPVADAIVLGHARQAALRACGRGAEEEAGNSNVGRIARAVAGFWSTSGRARDDAIRTAERIILELMNQIDGSELPRRAAERRGIDYRWLRRCALRLVSQLPRHCEATDNARGAWVETLRRTTAGLGLTIPAGRSINQFFPSRGGATWHCVFEAENPQQIQSSTVHDAKGKEYGAVCVVIPPDRAPLRRTEALVTSWQARTDSEAKRVVYVGLTRARKVAAIAIPGSFLERVQAILAGCVDAVRVHDLRA